MKKIKHTIENMVENVIDDPYRVFTSIMSKTTINNQCHISRACYRANQKLWRLIFFLRGYYVGYLKSHMHKAFGRMQSPCMATLACGKIQVKGFQLLGLIQKVPTQIFLLK